MRYAYPERRFQAYLHDCSCNVLKLTIRQMRAGSVMSLLLGDSCFTDNFLEGSQDLLHFLDKTKRPLLVCNTRCWKFLLPSGQGSINGVPDNVDLASDLLLFLLSLYLLFLLFLKQHVVLSLRFGGVLISHQ
jgi:hypothetical protein